MISSSPESDEATELADDDETNSDVSESSHRDEVDRRDDVEEIDERGLLENVSDFIDSVSELRFWSSSHNGRFLSLVNFFSIKKFNK